MFYVWGKKEKREKLDKVRIWVFISKGQKHLGQVEITRYCSSPYHLFFFLKNCSHVLAASFPSGELVEVERVNSEQPLITFFVMLASRKSQWRSSTHINRLQNYLYFKHLISVTLRFWSGGFFLSILKT